MSGYYLHKGYITNGNVAEIKTIEYIKHRYIRLFKDYIVAFIMALLVNVLVFKLDIISNLVLYIKEAFMVEIACIDSKLRVNPPDWYCGYLIISSTIVFIFQKIIKKNIKGISLFVGIVFYAILAIAVGHLCIFPLNASIISGALVRAIAGQMIGVFFAELVIVYNVKKLSQKTLKIVFALMLLIASYMLFWDMAFNIKDYLCLFLLAVFFMISGALFIKKEKL